jgi:hypothetical protein
MHASRPTITRWTLKTPLMTDPEISISVRQGAGGKARTKDRLWSLGLIAIAMLIIMILSMVDNTGEGYVMKLSSRVQLLMTVVFACGSYLGVVIAFGD